MRITRLHLARYGHLVDLPLDLPPDAGLHVVLGANEAGKSTALSAVADCLFGFGHRTEYDFLYPSRDLRVGVTLRTQDGREASFVRRKGTKDTLLDADGTPVPDGALAALLGGSTRERFLRVFGLDAAELRNGGAAILKGEGEVGESILQAHTGLQGFRAEAERLDEEARKISGRGKRALDLEADTYRAARTERDQRSVMPAAHKQAREELERLEREAVADEQERQTLQAERTTLDRIRRTAPARETIRRAEADLALLGPVPKLPDDAEKRYQQALLARETAVQTHLREQAREAELLAALDAQAPDATLLAEGEAIDALVADRNHVAAAARDLPARQAEAEQHRQAMLDAARRLGLPPDPDALAARIPDAFRREATRRAVLAHARLTERLTSARKMLAEAGERRDAAAVVLAALPETEAAADLRAAIDAGKAEGRIDAEHSDAVAAAETARTDLADALPGLLPFWSGSAAALVQAPMPLDAVVTRHAQTLAASEQSLRQCRERVAAHDAELASIGAELRFYVELGDLPTPEAIAATRARRDAAWRLLRRQHIDGGPAPSAAELDGLGLGEALPERFETLLRDADALADRRATDVERVVGYDQLRARAAVERARREAAAAAETEAAQVQDEALAQWRAAWQPAGIEPADPAAMREWLARRQEVLRLHERRAKAEDKVAAVALRRQAAWSAVAALLPYEAEAAAGRVAALLRAAGTVCAAREQAGQARAAAAAAVTTAEQAFLTARSAMDDAERDLSAWADDWRTAAENLGLPPASGAADGQLALDLWQQVEAVSGAFRTARTRIADMTRTVAAFADSAAAIAARAAADLGPLAPADCVRNLEVRLAASRAAAAERTRLTEELAKLRAALRRLAGQRADAEQIVVVLRTLADAADDAALQEAIGRARQHADLTADIAKRTAELRTLDGGKSRAELDAEAEGHDLDALPGRLALIDARLEAIGTAQVARAVRLTELRATLGEMERGQDAAGSAQAMKNALAEMRELAARYVRLRMAQTLLRAGIDRFRRRQQGPLLARAGALFADLTQGRYDRLEVEEADTGVLSIAALRPNGTHCPADRLSEGTRDQLYLALRLAAIESAAAGAEPLPFIADDLLAGFDDSRARAAMHVLAGFGATTQTILFTHHAHIAAMAAPAGGVVHELPAAA